ncbi:hypothetical protein [Stenotrophomonas sp. AB1(2024)]|uniref:hypothetical protein n=1 Tax=Stenotrophomonas sp. AB1(2024) TaxID=3132215 RepID=UPI0030A62235
MSLHVLMQGVPMGTLRQDAYGNPHFTYAPEWRGAAGAFRLSRGDCCLTTTTRFKAGRRAST